MNIELKILDFIQTLHIPILDKIMVWITSLGDAGMIWILLTAIFLMVEGMPSRTMEQGFPRDLDIL